MNKRFDKSISIEKWNVISRVLAFFVSIAIWWISISFSVQGFNFSLPDKVWIGWTLGFCITVIEIVFNKPNVRKNLTLWVVGALAYSYGMYTNVLGIWIAQGAISGFIHWIFPTILGCAIEWIPEVLFIWAILGTVTQEGDFLGNVIKMFSGNREDDFVQQESTPFKPIPKSPALRRGRPAKTYSPSTKSNALNLMKNKPDWDSDDYKL